MELSQSPKETPNPSPKEAKKILRIQKIIDAQNLSPEKWQNISKKIDELHDGAYGHSPCEKWNNAWDQIVQSFTFIEELTTLQTLQQMGFAVFVTLEQELINPTQSSILHTIITHEEKNLTPRSTQRKTIPKKEAEYLARRARVLMLRACKKAIRQNERDRIATLIENTRSQTY